MRKLILASIAVIALATISGTALAAPPVNHGPPQQTPAEHKAEMKQRFVNAATFVTSNVVKYETKAIDHAVDHGNSLPPHAVPHVEHQIAHLTQLNPAAGAKAQEKLDKALSH